MKLKSKAIIIPHANEIYCRFSIEMAFETVSNKDKIKNIIILSTDHSKNTDEHSYQFTKDIISEYFPKAKHHLYYVNHVSCPYHLENVRRLFKKDTTLLIANTDLSHVNGTFPIKIETHDDLLKMDSQTIKAITNSDEKILNKNYLCGYYVIVCLFQFLKLMGKEFYPRVTSYYNSLQIDIKNKNVNMFQIIEPLKDKSIISYVSIVFTTTKYTINNNLTNYEKMLCKENAKYVILLKNPTISWNLYTPCLQHKFGVFVTLTDNQGNIKGEDGTIYLNDNIINNIVKYTYNAMTNKGEYEKKNEIGEIKKNNFLNNNRGLEADEDEEKRMVENKSKNIQNRNNSFQKKNNQNQVDSNQNQVSNNQNQVSNNQNQVSNNQQQNENNQNQVNSNQNQVENNQKQVSNNQQQNENNQKNANNQKQNIAIVESNLEIKNRKLKEKELKLNGIEQKQKIKENNLLQKELIQKNIKKRLEENAKKIIKEENQLKKRKRIQEKEEFKLENEKKKFAKQRSNIEENTRTIVKRTINNEKYKERLKSFNNVMSGRKTLRSMIPIKGGQSMRGGENNMNIRITLLDKIRPIQLNEYLNIQSKKYKDGHYGLYVRNIGFYLPNKMINRKWTRKEQLKSLCKDKKIIFDKKIYSKMKLFVNKAHFF
jgi:hypothetical protein